MIDIKQMQQDYLAYRKAQDNMPKEQRIANENSHQIGVVDDRYGCIYCEVTPHNAWRYSCN
jgi:hypothetical protein